MGFTLPVGINFADGITVLPGQNGGIPSIIGTPLPTANFFIYSNGGSTINIEEEAGSPEIERAEQCTCSHTLKMSWVQCINYWTQLGRGVIVTDTGGNIWRILSCKIKREKATLGELSYVMESISFDSPPDDFSIEDVSMDLDIIKHPRYAWALLPYVSDALTYVTVGGQKIYFTEVKSAIVRAIQSYKDSPVYPNANTLTGQIQDNVLSQLRSGKIQVTIPNPNFIPPTNATVLPPATTWSGNLADLSTASTPSKISTDVQNLIVTVSWDLTDVNHPLNIAMAAANELIQKLWRQEDTPYIAGWQISWTQYFFQPVYLNPGGYIEDPRNVVPDYFLNPNSHQLIPRSRYSVVSPVSDFYGNDDTQAAGGAGNASIFDYLVKINPQCYSVNGTNTGALSMSCLRKSDSYEYERTWFKTHHTWLCAPVGKWDSDLFTSNNRPQNASGYNQLPVSFGS